MVQSSYVSMTRKNLLLFKCSALLTLLYGSCGSHFDINQQSDKLFTTIPAKYSGLKFQNHIEQTRENNHLLSVEFVSGSGVAVGDINNDGLQDVFFAANQLSDKLYLNKGNFKFEDISKRAGIIDDNGWSTAVTLVDIDNDGDQDIYVCRFVYLENDKSANQLYINNGDLTFSEEAEKYGLADKGFSTHAAFCDFDKDGLIDIYIVNQPPSIPGKQMQISEAGLSNILFSDRMYKNQGGGAFTDITIKSNIRNFGFGLCATVADFNEDGWQDIYVSNDFDVADHLYINQKDGTFTDVIQQATGHITHFSMGNDVADYDNDGHLDVMVLDMIPEDHVEAKTHMTSIIPEEFWNTVNKGGHYQYMMNTLQRNNGNGTFSELARLAGVASTGWSWGPLLADFDLDGYKDIFITNGVKSNNLHGDLAVLYQQKVDSLAQVARRKNVDPKDMIDVFDFVDIATSDVLPNYIYKNNGDYTFSKKMEEWGMEMPTISHGAAYADFDLDGDLDLVSNRMDGPALLFKNNAVENGLGNFLRFKLIPVQDQNIYGTKVTLYRDHKLWQVCQVTNTRGYRSKSEDLVHFGIGKDTVVSRVQIEWQDGTKNIIDHIAANQLLVVNQKDGSLIIDADPGAPDNLLFKNVADDLNLSQILHKENPFDDHIRELLLPHKMSRFGPPIGVGDVNGDGKEDFFMGGAAGIPGTLFLQNSRGNFEEIKEGGWNGDRASEDMDVAFVDVDSDTDLDMIIVSGGNEFNEGDPRLQDRLYINNGGGLFTKKMNAMPVYYTSGSCVVPKDFDRDGDTDLFIGGRLVPGQYPLPASSLLLENRDGTFVDVSREKAPEMTNLGLVTAAQWIDHNRDGLDDLVIVGEWMPITFFTQFSDGHFEKQIMDGLTDSQGWYYEVKCDDMDGDGDEDLVVGNLGLNYTYRVSAEEPLEIFSYDFDRNGRLDIVLGYYENGKLYPVEERDNTIKQIPAIGRKFDTFEKYGQADLMDIYGESLNEALNLKAKTFASAYIENLGNDSFRIKPLPNLTQVSSVNNILIKDYDLDGNKDLLLSGNLFQTDVDIPRNDAGTGLLLKGNGAGDFESVPLTESGFSAPFDAKDMKTIYVRSREIILVGNNSNYLQAIEYIPPESVE